MLISDVMGWVGASLLVGAYFLVSTKKILPTSVTYQLMNLFGALGAMVNVFVQKAYPSVILEFVWASIAIYGLYKAFKH